MIITAVIKATLIFLSGLSDRIRGGWKGPSDALAGVRKLPVLFEGLVFFFMTLAVLGLGAIIPAAIAGVIAGLWSWRQDNGWRGQFVFGNEGYDPGDKHRWYLPIRFGAWQGFWFFPLMVFNPAFGFLINACIAGQCLSMYLSEKLWSTHIDDGRAFDIKNAWPGSELLGPICTALLWLLMMGGLMLMGVQF